MAELKILTEIVIDVDDDNDQHCGAACKWRITSRGGYVQCCAFVPNTIPLQKAATGRFPRTRVCLARGDSRNAPTHMAQLLGAALSRLQELGDTTFKLPPALRTEQCRKPNDKT